MHFTFSFFFGGGVILAIIVLNMFTVFEFLGLFWKNRISLQDQG